MCKVCLCIGGDGGGDVDVFVIQPPVSVDTAGCLYAVVIADVLSMGKSLERRGRWLPPPPPAGLRCLVAGRIVVWVAGEILVIDIVVLHCKRGRSAPANEEASAPFWAWRRSAYTMPPSIARAVKPSSTTKPAPAAPSPGLSRMILNRHYKISF